MGWYFTQGQTRRQLITELTAARIRTEDRRAICIASCTRGNILWSVWCGQVRGEGHQEWIGHEKFICCDLMQVDRGYGWGHKPMSEDMGPFYYTCPLGYLDMVPEVADQNWRDNVKAYHAQRKAA